MYTFGDGYAALLATYGARPMHIAIPADRAEKVHNLSKMDRYKWACRDAVTAFEARLAITSETIKALRECAIWLTQQRLETSGALARQDVHAATYEPLTTREQEPPA